MSYILAADIGGTKLAAALFDINQQLLSTKEVASDNTNRETLFACLIGSFAQLCAERKLRLKKFQRYLLVCLVSLILKRYRGLSK